MKWGLVSGIVLALILPAVLAADLTPAAEAELKHLQARLADPDRPLTWVMTGDSITQGAKWLGSARAYPELVEEAIRWQRQRRRDFFVNTAISGERTGGLLADFDWRVKRFNPDVVSLMIGMNDAVAGPAGRVEFADNLRRLVQAIRASGAIPLLHLTNPIDDVGPSSAQRRDLPAYNAIIAEIAIETNTIVIDHWSVWQEQHPTLATLRTSLADPIHPNAAGHALFAQTVLRTLDLTPPTP